MHVVWFKRDLRVHDHAPLAQAAQHGPVLPLYIAEPSVLCAPDFDTAHWQFIHECLAELREALAALGAPLVVRVGEAVEVLAALHTQHPFAALWAHEETGNALTYARDRAVRRWARTARIPVHELPQTGAVRGLKDRDHWHTIWERRMHARPIDPPGRIEGISGIEPGPIPDHAMLGLRPPSGLDLQCGGERQAQATLASFLRVRGQRYHREMSSPLTAEASGSRISPYLAWGALSVKQAVAAAQARQRELEAIPFDQRSDLDADWRRALFAFQERLRWRDHFIQKLETEPEIEYRSFIPIYDSVRPFNQPRYDAWAHGQTGYPLVDACMRALHHTRWINFRMRAMLTSFAAYDLFLPWQQPSILLARLFLDYEPGIHYSQAQMQSGTTGINTMRVYNPTKQAQEQDPDGVFIRRWVPELAGVPNSFIHAPWLMPTAMQQQVGCLIGRTYPAPVVEHEAASRRAKDALYALRRHPYIRAQADEVQRRHGSRRPTPPRRPRRTRPESSQLRLF
jgi:deoxyribodipyrimidine photo-lyase